MRKLLPKLGILLGIQIFLTLSCGIFFLKPKVVPKDKLNLLFAGWVLQSNANIVNQILLDKTITTLREGEEMEINVTLSKFVGDGRIYFKSDNPSILFNGADNTSLQFSKETISIPQKLIISAKEDDNNRNENSTLEFGGEKYAVLRIPVEIKDNDVQRILTYNASPTLDEGKSSELRIRLNTKPDNIMIVTLSSTDTTSLQIDKQSVTFTPENYSTEQIVLLNAPEDSDSTSETTSINLSMTGAENETVSVKIVDNDIQPVFNLASVSINEGNTTTITIQLNGEPGADKTISLSSSNPNSLTVTPTTLSFTTTNWNTPQTITLTALQDTNYDHESITLTAASLGLSTGNIPITTIDDGVQSVVFTGPTQMNEGQTITVNLNLALKPTFNTTVSLSLNSPILQIYPSSFTFTPTNYSTPKVLTLTAIPNDGNENSEYVTLTASANSMANSDYTILVIDKDTKILFSNFTIPITEGQSGSMQVSLSGNPQIANTVNLNSSWSLVTLGEWSQIFIILSR